MSAFKVLPVWVDAYLSDTHPELNLEEHGCYLMLLMLSWKRDSCTLPNDDTWFCRALNCHGNKWRILRKRVLERFFLQDHDGRWYQKRLRKERDFVEKTRRNQKKKAEKRWAQRNENNGLVNATADAPSPSPSPVHTTYVKKESSPYGETKKENASLPARPTPKPVSRGSRIPDSWSLSEAEREYAIQLGFSLEAIEMIALDFEQYWRAKAGKEAVKMDWHLTWQRWVRNSAGYKHRNGSNGKNVRSQLIDFTREIERQIETIDDQMAKQSNGNSADTIERGHEVTKIQDVFIHSGSRRLL